MTKSILKLMGIVLFFFLVGFVLTYPYELSYNGSDSIVLLEDSYEQKSLEELLDKKEFEGKILYIRIWEPFEPGIKPYTDNELKIFKNQLDSIKQDNESDGYRLLTMKIEGRIVRTSYIEEELKTLEAISRKYKNNEVGMVYITDPDNKSQSRKDDFRKWKTAIKKYGLTGYHMIMNPRTTQQVKGRVEKITSNQYLPIFLLADKNGNIANYQAPWPQDSISLYQQINHLLEN